LPGNDRKSIYVSSFGPASIHDLWGTEPWSACHLHTQAAAAAAAQSVHQCQH
jgi:hypothetical protein